MSDKKVIDSWSILEFLKWKEREDAVEDEETYLVRVAVGHRIAIFEPVREFLGIEVGDLLRVTVQIEEKRQEPVEDLPPDETEPEIIVEEPIEEPVEEPTIETVDETEEDIPREVYGLKGIHVAEDADGIVETPPEDEPELDEVEPEQGESWGQEHVEPCPKGLDWPLQKPEVCRGEGCDFYRRKYGENPQRCTWPDWLKVGWEDEEAKSDEKIEETNENEKDEFPLIYCESGAHKPGLIPHEKRDLGDGWAMYTCLSCKKSTPMVVSKVEGDPEAEGP